MESRMQPATDPATQAQTPAEGSCGLIARLLDRAYCGKGVDTLVEEAANEITRLHTVIDSYVRSSQAAADEIKTLRSKVYGDRIVVVDGGVVQ